MFTSSRRSFIALCSLVLSACKHNEANREDNLVSDNPGCWCIDSLERYEDGIEEYRCNYLRDNQGNAIEQNDSHGTSYSDYDESGNRTGQQASIKVLEINTKRLYIYKTNDLGLPTSIDIETFICSGNNPEDEDAYFSDGRAMNTSIDYFSENDIKSVVTRTCFPDDDLMVSINDHWSIDDVKVTYETAKYDKNGMIQTAIYDYLSYSESAQDELTMALHRESVIYEYEELDANHIQINEVRAYYEGYDESYFEENLLPWFESFCSFEYGQDDRIKSIHYFNEETHIPVSYENGRVLLELTKESIDNIAIDLDDYGNTAKITTPDEMYEFEYKYVDNPSIVCIARSSIHPMIGFIYPDILL